MERSDKMNKVPIKTQIPITYSLFPSTPSYEESVIAAGLKSFKVIKSVQPARPGAYPDIICLTLWLTSLFTVLSVPRSCKNYDLLYCPVGLAKTSLSIGQLRQTDQHTSIITFESYYLATGIFGDSNHTFQLPYEKLFKLVRYGNLAENSNQEMETDLRIVSDPSHSGH